MSRHFDLEGLVVLDRLPVRVGHLQIDRPQHERIEDLGPPLALRWNGGEKKRRQRRRDKGLGLHRASPIRIAKGAREDSGGKGVVHVPIDH